ncbi:methylenetetrahydrofolate reductase [NAD(P)H] [Lentilactobacillus otakiensis]|uniref:Methylenetetrahydrofolate reductase n=1 Tax=Lentilactobacillus otakiensis DSM 19908 = JCM 15040 TaxID=1423780 RepID=S4PP07_9LACO|nr:methylenetetrahydrofolate reductase [NAD(P)H] [Lentilactobacillus otakiensis]KRL10391.1 5,10-methylenetetrahydrofolate reductase [Lentilactobacillus otakiensis DSM 19908 = JCM 15040]MBZ3777060.1 methylenetetrahydrofolate reductase [NAD(P)H] [Lentilactobacillus otakiensis]MDV3518083.1 methylenetetrahydrofolate reductase [NAD(P)H] [Lentilactobacillus otakiensis]GAD16185.1 5,10-methylenetetrahydrofolate reductase [Lentilactobacillus otakiensis DSM 19908 = JCM 15040]
MSLTALFKTKTVFSLEVFPPKKSSPTDAILPTLKRLQSINPDFISVTLGAGGTEHCDGTVEIANIIQNKLNIPAISHVPGLYQTKSEVLALLDRLDSINVKNILALRGDKIPGKEPAGDFNHANELVQFVHEQRPDFSIASACYPNCHTEAPDFVDDITHLKEKVDAGADHLISQLFFDNQAFYDFKEKTEIAGIHVPIEAGIMPCTNKNQIERITQISGVPIPKKFAAIMDRYQNSEEAMLDAGIAFAVDQIIDLVSQGVDGIHLYTMNKSKIAKRIWDETKSVFAAADLAKQTANQ